MQIVLQAGHRNQNFRLVCAIIHSPQEILFSFTSFTHTQQNFKDTRGNIQFEVKYVNVAVLR